MPSPPAPRYQVGHSAQVTVKTQDTSAKHTLGYQTFFTILTTAELHVKAPEAADCCRMLHMWPSQDHSSLVRMAVSL